MGTLLTYRYSLYDVPFTADVALALPGPPPGAPIRLDIRAEPEEPPPALAADRLDHEVIDGWMALRAYSSGRMEIEFADWLLLRIDAGGRQVGYRVREQAYPTAFEAYIANFALSGALLLQGEETLHATVVDHDGRGIGLLGHSGAGKSTFAAWLLSQGGDLVTDDMLRITETGGAAYAEPGQPRLKLMPDAAERHFAGSANEGAANRGRWNPVSEKYLFDTAAPAAPRRRCRLDLLVWLGAPADDRPDEIALRRLTGLEAFNVLAGSAMNTKLQTADRLARQLRFIERVARRVPLYELRYPRRPDVFPELVAQLMGADRAAR